VFILSPGNNPLPKLSRFAQSHSRVVVSISLGRGRGAKAQEMFDKYRAQSRWLVLENCHLAGAWMPQVRCRLHLTPWVRVRVGVGVGRRSGRSPASLSSLLRSRLLRRSASAFTPNAERQDLAFVCRGSSARLVRAVSSAAKSSLRGYRHR
jgi:hypothetical protein